MSLTLPVLIEMDVVSIIVTGMAVFIVIDVPDVIAYYVVGTAVSLVIIVVIGGFSFCSY